MPALTAGLDADELRSLQAFLEPSRIAVLAAIGPSGMPQLTPNWYVFAGGRLAISTRKETYKYRNLTRDQRLAVCIYSEPNAQDYVVVTGRVEITDDDSIWPTTRAIVARYVELGQVEERMDLLRMQNRVIISLTPEKVAFRS